MLRVVHVTTVHPRHDMRILRKECVSLAAAGYDVVLVVGDGQGDEVSDGVRIVDVGGNSGRRLARMLRQTNRALKATRALHPKLVHVHDPELLFVASRLAAEGIPVIYDAHEDVPRQILNKEWIAPVLRPIVSCIFELFENYVVRNLAGVVAATPHIERRFARLHIETVNVGNFPLLREVDLWSGTVVERERAVCYVGDITRARGVREIVRMMELLPDVVLLLCGLFEDEMLEAELRSMPGWSRVEYLGRVERREVGVVMRRSSVGMVTLLPTPSYTESLPIKMFEYMSAALPVVASDFPLWRRIIDQEQCGLCVDPRDPQAMAVAVSSILSNRLLGRAMGDAGRKSVTALYNWSNEERKLLVCYGALLGKADRVRRMKSCNDSG